MGYFAQNNTMDNPENNQINKVEFLWKVISRYDHYINSTNAKASLVIAWNGIVIGAVLLQYEDILKTFSVKPNGQLVASICMFLLGLLSLVSNFFVFRVVTPYVPNGETQKSLIYFGSVSKMEQHKYDSLLSEADQNSIISDLSAQVTDLASILETKMKKTKTSIVFMCIGLAIIYFMLVYMIS